MVGEGFLPEAFGEAEVGGEVLPFGRAVNPGGSEIKWSETDSVGRRIGGKLEITGFGIGEMRIGENRAAVLADALPFFPGVIGESGGGIFGIPVKVVFEFYIVIAPGTAEEIGAFPPNDVSGKSEGEVVFRAGSLQLVFVTECEDVVADDVVASVVLMESAGFGIINEVVFHYDIAAPFVCIESPAAIGMGIDIVDDVVGDSGPGGGAEGVDSGHVAEDILSDVADSVKGDAVVFRETGIVSPAPADGDSGVEEVRDIVVSDDVVAALSDPDTDGARKNSAAVVEDVVVDDDVACLVADILVDVSGSNADSAGPEVVKVGAANGDIAAAVSKPDTVATVVAHLAVFDGDVFGSVCHNVGFD